MPLVGESGPEMFVPKASGSIVRDYTTRIDELKIEARDACKMAASYDKQEKPIEATFQRERMDRALDELANLL